MDKAISVKKNVIFNWIRIGVSLLFPLITTPYISRVLGSEGIGKVNYIYSIVGYFAAFAIMGISDYAIREGGKIRSDKQALGKFATEMIILNIITTTIASLAYVSLLLIPSLHRYHSLILLMYAYIPMSALGMSWVFQVFEDYRRITLQAIIIQCISVGLMFLLIRSEEDILGYAFLHIFSTVGANIAYFVSASRKVKLFGYGHYQLKKHLKPIVTIFVLGLAASLYLNFDITMLGAIVGDESVGIYHIAVKIINITEKVLTSISGVMLARLSYYVGTNQRDKFESLVQKTMSCIIILAVPAAVGIFCLAKPAVLLLSGPGFLSAVQPLRVLCFKIIFSSLNGFLVYQLLLPLNKEHMSAVATIVSCVTNLVLNYFVIPKYHETGAAFTTVIAELCVFVICIVVARKTLRRISLSKTIVDTMIASFPIPLIAWSVFKITDSIVLRLFVPVVTCVAIYFIILIVLKNSIVLSFYKSIQKKILRKC